MAHVFISYVTENLKEVESLCDELTQVGIEIWIDRNDIKPGQRWKDAIRRAIRSGDFFIACFSQEYKSCEKTYMNTELKLAIDELSQYATNREWFIPVLLSKCDIPDYSIGGGESLHDIQFIDLFTNWQSGIDRLIKVIKPIPTEVKNHITILDSQDDVLKIRGAQELARLGDERAVPALINALSDKDMFVRAGVAHALLSFSDPRSVPALIIALVDKSQKVRDLAEHALLKIGEPAIPALKESLNNENSVIREAAADTLSGIETKRKLFEYTN